MVHDASAENGPPALFGPKAAAPRNTLIKDWAADPLTATADDPHAAGHPSAQPGPTGPWAGALILAGSEASPRDAGYLFGAVDAARHATAAVMADRAA